MSEFVRIKEGDLVRVDMRNYMGSFFRHMTIDLFDDESLSKRATPVIFYADQTGIVLEVSKTFNTVKIVADKGYTGWCRKLQLEVIR